MKNKVFYFLSGVLIFLFIGTTAFVNERTNRSDSTVNWLTFEEAVERSKTEKKKIFIDVYTDWCGYCKVMDKNTFSQADIAQYLNENFYPVKFNAEQKQDITFRGHTFIPQWYSWMKNST